MRDSISKVIVAGVAALATAAPVAPTTTSASAAAVFHGGGFGGIGGFHGGGFGGVGQAQHRSKLPPWNRPAAVGHLQRAGFEVMKTPAEVGGAP
jgi:hypothetical protein